MNSNASEQKYTAFLPVLLLSLSLVAFFVWNMVLTVRLRAGAARVRDQQEMMVLQAMQAEERMKRMMVDLLELAKTDEDAEAIVTKYNIVFNEPVSSLTEAISGMGTGTVADVAAPLVTEAPTVAQPPDVSPADE